ncbi:hypothetical protein QVD17_26588 [Tagetes erecta]|uniref:Uncharacterized protein n=1 Tax=Tagetes erecta TaxID=13708 RepID=A0AAD8KAE0_TARER|nr:hypothetical protein QVD17_26588 [Tagetes erecta]
MSSSFVFGDHNPFTPLEILTLAADEQLIPPSASQYPFHLHPFSLQNPLYTSIFDQSLTNLNSKSAYFESTSVGGKLSTVEIVKLAAEKFIKFSMERQDEYGSSGSMMMLTMEDMREMELVFQLLNAADEIEQKRFENATKYLMQCLWVANDGGSPVERLVFYLCDALQTRIANETGMPAPTKLENFFLKNKNPMAIGTNPTFLAFHQALPFSQVLQLCGIQAIVDQIGTSTKIHLIDIHIRSGVQWTALMQALADREPKITLLKLTAFATSSDILNVEKTGKQLESFAKIYNLPFLFKTLVLSDISEVKKEQFEVQEGEAIAVYCYIILRTMVSRPRSLEKLMRAIQKINPLVVVVGEVEANHNSTSFVNRFTETLFYYGALFDCLEASMSPDDCHRVILEGVHFGDGMKNILAEEGDERVCRSVHMNTWRLFFARFGMVGIALSDSCVYQASLVLQQYSCVSSCMLENKANCLVVGWKGTPLLSLSTWKFGHKVTKKT